MESTRGIVLNIIQFLNSQYIAHVYTEKFGRISVIFSNKPSQGLKKKLVQPLYLIELQTNINTKTEIKRAQNISLWKPYISIPNNPQKIFINLFLAEVLSKTLFEQEPNQSLFQFCTNSLLLFDQTETEWKNFHLVFIVHLMKHLGICPTSEMVSPDPIVRRAFELVINTPIHEFRKITLSRTERNSLLVKILEHYKNFLPIGDISSHTILAKL